MKKRPILFSAFAAMLGSGLYRDFKMGAPDDYESRKAECDPGWGKKKRDRYYKLVNGLGFDSEAAFDIVNNHS